MSAKFFRISVIYFAAQILFTITAFFSLNLINGTSYSVSIFLGVFILTILYFLILQKKVRNRIFPSIFSLAGICVTAGLTIFILALLVIEPVFHRFYWSIFAFFYSVGTIFIAKKLWISSE